VIIDDARATLDDESDKIELVVDVSALGENAGINVSSIVFQVTGIGILHTNYMSRSAPMRDMDCTCHRAIRPHEPVVGRHNAILRIR
jgi:hypothetical protein